MFLRSIVPRAAAAAAVRPVGLRPSLSRSFGQYVDVQPAVRDALQRRGAIVALESTIVTHGMPWPHNLRTARRVEEIVRERGATPATIAIVDGRIKVGLEAEELELLAASADPATEQVRGMRMWETSDNLHVDPLMNYQCINKYSMMKLKAIGSVLIYLVDISDSEVCANHGGIYIV